MALWRSLGGMIRVQLTSADIYGTLDAMDKRGILLEQVEPSDGMQLEFSFHRKDFMTVSRICENRGDELKVLGHLGILWQLRTLLHRPVLVLGLLGILFLALWTPGRVFFVFVEGNADVPTNLIIEKAAFCGIDFGANRRSIRSEQVKNTLLAEIPELQWVGVNTQGCVAVISVRERAVSPEEEKSYTVSSIVAARDGVIREMTVLEGSPLCVSGQAVRAGQVLISGYTDCGICIRAGNAKGEIYAETVRYFSAIYPAQRLKRVQKVDETKKYSLIIGKKRINFYNNSGISGGECVRIYLEQYLTLPGGFRLPIAIAIEQTISYETQIGTNPQPEEIILPYMTNYLQSQMIGGRILTSSENGAWVDGYYRIDAIFGCYEMIGLLRPEESLSEYENR